MQLDLDALIRSAAEHRGLLRSVLRIAYTTHQQNPAGVAFALLKRGVWGANVPAYKEAVFEIEKVLQQSAPLPEPAPLPGVTMSNAWDDEDEDEDDWDDDPEDDVWEDDDPDEDADWLHDEDDRDGPPDEDWF